MKTTANGYTVLEVATDQFVVTVYGNEPQKIDLGGQGKIEIPKALIDKGVASKKGFLTFNQPIIVIVKNDRNFEAIRVYPADKEKFLEIWTTILSNPKTLELVKKVTAALDLIQEGDELAKIFSVLTELEGTKWTKAGMELIKIIKTVFPDEWEKIEKEMDPSTVEFVNSLS